jgi:hypothetical protein
LLQSFSWKRCGKQGTINHFSWSMPCYVIPKMTSILNGASCPHQLLSDL